MRQTTVSASNSQKWSGPIIVLGKGVPAYSTAYGCLICCIAAVSEHGGWVRLYPLFLEPVLSTIKPIEKFDVIRVVFRDRYPESSRPESRKIFPEFVEKVGHVHDENVRMDILRRYTEPGVFLHDGSWRGRKTLGMIKPFKVRFSLTQENIPMVKFKCGRSCSGHNCQIGELMRFDSVGRAVPRKDAELAKQFSSLKNKELRFVMGTIRRHPSKWLLISIYTIGEDFNN